METLASVLLRKPAGLLLLLPFRNFEFDSLDLTQLNQVPCFRAQSLFQARVERIDSALAETETNVIISSSS